MLKKFLIYKKLPHVDYIFNKKREKCLLRFIDYDIVVRSVFGNVANEDLAALAN